ncbi:MAG: PAS domain S-box protein [Salinivirgaceae bacterium]|nr:PAS domain S-box protein [Salinivirgaceae bacterium]
MKTWLQKNRKEINLTFFSEIIDIMSDCVFVIDHQNKIVSCNRVASETFAILQPISPFSINELLVDKSQAQFETLINDARTQKRSSECGLYFSVKSTSQWFSATSIILIDNQNRDSEHIGLILTQNNSNDEKVVCEQKKERRIQELILNRDFNVISNRIPACLYCYEEPTDKTSLESFIDLVNPDFIEITLNTLAKCVEELQLSDCEVIMPISGEDTWVLIRFYPRKFDHKFFIETHIIDISHRRYKTGIKSNEFHITSSLVRIGTIFSKAKDITVAIQQSMQYILEELHLDTLVIYRDVPEEHSFILDNRVIYSQLIVGYPLESIINYSTVLGFKKILENYELIVSGSTSESMTKSLQERIEKIGICSYVLAPIFIAGKFYGALVAGNNKDRIWTNIEVSFLHGSSLILGQNIDREITKREILSTRNDFINIFNNASDLVFIIAFNGTILEANRTAIRALGYNRRDLLGKHVERISTVSSEPDSILAGEMHQSRQLTFGTTLKKKSGETIPIEVKEKIVTYNNQKCILTIARDITDRKLFDRLILQTIIETEERERKRFAESLHDDLGPLLSALKIYVDLLVSKKFDPHTDQLAMDQMKQIIEQAIATIRQTAHNIMPNVLSDFGLSEALNDFINKLRTTQVVEIEFFESNPEYVVKNNRAKILFSAIKELVSNSLRHANARKIGVKLLVKDESFVVEYTDDGIGFDFNAVARGEHDGMGIKNIVSKIDSLGGKIISKKVSGLGIFIEITIDK